MEINETPQFRIRLWDWQRMKIAFVMSYSKVSCRLVGMTENTNALHLCTRGS